MSSRPIAFITGASSGIGAVFASKLAARGYDLILTARRTDRLTELAAQLPGEHEVLGADLAIEADQQKLAARLKGEPRLELLINNAGFGTTERFWKAGWRGQYDMHQVHVMATAALTHAALPGMLKRGRGAVINVASVASFMRSQSNVSYCATKAWMLAFSEALALELRGVGTPVQVQALCPGFTYSEFHDVLGVNRATIPKWMWMPADFVVEASLRGLARRQTVVIPGWKYRVFTSLFTRLPHGLRMALQGRSPHTKARLQN